MTYETLKDEIGRIAELSTTVPEAFQGICFEVLLTHLLRQTERGLDELGASYLTTPTAEPSGGQRVPTPSQVRVFMQRNKVSQQTLEAVVMYIDGALHFIEEPAPPTVAEGQVQWALLLALRNAITSNSFQVDPEDVRSMCQEKGFYDASNFARNFKGPSTKRLFKGLLKPRGEPQQLTAEGETELATLLVSLCGTAN